MRPSRYAAAIGTAHAEVGGLQADLQEVTMSAGAGAGMERLLRLARSYPFASIWSPVAQNLLKCGPGETMPCSAARPQWAYKSVRQGWPVTPEKWLAAVYLTGHRFPWRSPAHLGPKSIAQWTHQHLPAGVQKRTGPEGRCEERQDSRAIAARTVRSIARRFCGLRNCTPAAIWRTILGIKMLGQRGLCRRWLSRL